jgi:hypothetical protein
MITARSRSAAFGVTALAFALVLARPSLSLAGEPGNNTPPWSTLSTSSFHGDASIFTTTASGCEFGTAEAITSPTDVDYFVVTCGGYSGGGYGTVKSVTIRFPHANGDLDMQVYATNGTLLGSSTGITDTEVVDVSAQKRGGVVVKVYGYHGALNPYTVIQSCQP